MWKLPQQEIAKVKGKGVYSQSVEDVFIKHDGHYFKFCILRSIVLKQFRKTLGLCQTFLLVSQGRSDKTIASSKTIVFSFQKEQFQYFLTNI